MAVSLDNSVRDAGLNDVKNNVTKLVVCKGVPTDYTDAINTPGDVPAGKNVSGAAGITMAAGDFTLQDRTGGGRELVVAAKTGGTVSHATVNGVDDLHFVLLDVANTVIKAVNDETSDQSLAVGNPIETPSFKIGMPNSTAV